MTEGPPQALILPIPDAVLDRMSPVELRAVIETLTDAITENVQAGSANEIPPATLKDILTQVPNDVLLSELGARRGVCAGLAIELGTLLSTTPLKYTAPDEAMRAALAEVIRKLDGIQTGAASCH
jgi:hypothetical protein